MHDFSSGSAAEGAALSNVYSPNVYFCRTPGWLAVHRGVPNPLQPAQSNSPSGPREAAPPRHLCKPSLTGSSLPFCASPPPALDHPIPAEITNTQTHRHVVRQTASQAQGTAKTGTVFPSIITCCRVCTIKWLTSTIFTTSMETTFSHFIIITCLFI